MSLGSDEAPETSAHPAKKRQRVSADEAPMVTESDTHTPAVILSDADADLFSKLTYEEAAAFDAHHGHDLARTLSGASCVLGPAAAMAVFSRARVPTMLFSRSQVYWLW